MHMTLFDHELTNYNYYTLTINNKSIDYELTIITYHKISLDLHRPPSFDRPFLMPAIFGTSHPDEVTTTRVEMTERLPSSSLYAMDEILQAFPKGADDS